MDGTGEKIEEFTRELEVFSEEKNQVPTIKEQKGPALVYLAAGAWYTNLQKGKTADERLEAFHEAISNTSNMIDVHGKNMFTDPMDPIDGIGNQIFFAPPAGPCYQGDKEWNINDTDRRAAEIIQMQDWLHESDGKWNIPLAWAMPALVSGQNKTWVDPLITGFHVIDSVAETRANILLNLRCNAKMDRILPYPYHRTCCTDYGIKPAVQQFFVFICLVHLVACIVGEVLDIFAARTDPRWSLINMKTGPFSLALLMCYYADRTQLMAKGSTLWSYHDFFMLCIPCVTLALVTIRKSRLSARAYKPLALQDDQAVPAEKDEPFLSRDQTEEWKGWMQFVILIYHWTGAQVTPVYVTVRLLVAAYLFQTGYGHTLFFLNKKDFSFNRAASVLLRLNLLTFSLTYIMDTDYMNYYFSPLVSFWFLVVYATLAVGRERCNNDVQLLLVKTFISALLVSGGLLFTPVNKWLFWGLRYAFKVQWSYREWDYRVSLDIFIVYIGMFVAIAYRELQRNLYLSLRITLALVGCVAIGAYFHATSGMSHKEYLAWHPYFSIIPVLSFIAMRNVSGNVRNYYSNAMAWLGKCSLETYTLQFHLFLAADSKGVLLVDGLFGDGSVLNDRWRSLLIVVPMFLWISSATATATGDFVKAIMKTSSTDLEKGGNPMMTSVVRRIPGSSYLTAPKFRIICILVIFWMMNIMSPSHDIPKAPDGVTAHNSAHSTAAAMHTPAA